LKKRKKRNEEMKPTFKSIAIFFLGLLIGIIAAVLIIEKQYWFWYVKKDRGILILEVRKINLEKEDIDDLIRKLRRFIDETDRALGIEEKK